MQADLERTQEGLLAALVFPVRGGLIGRLAARKRSLAESIPNRPPATLGGRRARRES
jgi:hypothetical protein